MTRYVLDTSLYIRAFREREAARALARWYEAFTPFTHLHAVVLHELLAGATTPAKARQVRHSVAAPFERTRRLVTPSHEAWAAAGEALADMAREEGLELRRVPKSFVHDVVLATSCREAGVTLVTENARDFERIRRWVDMEWLEAWPW